MINSKNPLYVTDSRLLNSDAQQLSGQQQVLGSGQSRGVFSTSAITSAIWRNNKCTGR